MLKYKKTKNQRTEIINPNTISSFAALFGFSHQSVTTAPSLNPPTGSKYVAPVSGRMCMAVKPTALGIAHGGSGQQNYNQ